MKEPAGQSLTRHILPNIEVRGGECEERVLPAAVELEETYHVERTIFFSPAQVNIVVWIAGDDTQQSEDVPHQLGIDDGSEILERDQIVDAGDDI